MINNTDAEKAGFETTSLEKIMMKQLEALGDPDCDIEKETKKASSMVGVATVLINAAKVKIDAVRVNKLIGAKEEKEEKAKAIATKKSKEITNG